MDVVHTQNFFGSRECVRMAEKEAAGGEYTTWAWFFMFLSFHMPCYHIYATCFRCVRRET